MKTAVVGDPADFSLSWEKKTTDNVGVALGNRRTSDEQKFYSMHISRFNPDGTFATYEDKIYVRTSVTDPSAEALFSIPNGSAGGNFLIQYVFDAPRYYVWPIPQSAIDQSATGALRQNPL